MSFLSLNVAVLMSLAKDVRASRYQKAKKLSLSKNLCKRVKTPTNSVKARVGDRRNTVEEKKALRTCQELLAVDQLSANIQTRRES